jgi:putative ABC transport system ATP-binding protein
MIEVSNISKQVSTSEGTLTILDKINLSITSGETLAIVGPSGSGKSTLLGILAGLDLPTTGTVILNGQNITAMDEEGRAAVRAGHVGFVFQSFHLLPGLTALENVALPLELQGDKDALKTAAHYLTRVGLDHRTTHYPRQLSGGEQQRVAVARAFACKPTILFADEPTGNLDTGTGEKINDLLFDLNKEEGTTLVLVTHEHNLAKRCGKRLVLAGGLQVEESPVAKPAKSLAEKPEDSPVKKKAPVKKAPIKKASVKKVSVKKVAAKKVPVKKAPVKKISAETAVGQNTPDTKPSVKKATVKKALVKKAPVKKAPVKKAPVKKAPVKKAPVKKKVAVKPKVKATAQPTKELKQKPKAKPKATAKPKAKAKGSES